MRLFDLDRKDALDERCECVNAFVVVRIKGEIGCGIAAETMQVASYKSAAGLRAFVRIVCYPAHACIVDLDV